MSKELFDLTGKVAIVTGAACRLGKAIAQGLANTGASVVIADIDYTEYMTDTILMVSSGYSACRKRKMKRYIVS